MDGDSGPVEGTEGGLAPPVGCQECRPEWFGPRIDEVDHIAIRFSTYHARYNVYQDDEKLPNVIEAYAPDEPGHVAFVLQSLGYSCGCGSERLAIRRLEGGRVVIL